MFALTILGIQRFAGDEILQGKVASLKVVPEDVDGTSPETTVQDCCFRRLFSKQLTGISLI